MANTFIPTCGYNPYKLKHSYHVKTFNLTATTDEFLHSIESKVVTWVIESNLKHIGNICSVCFWHRLAVNYLTGHIMCLTIQYSL